MLVGHRFFTDFPHSGIDDIELEANAPHRFDADEKSNADQERTLSIHAFYMLHPTWDPLLPTMLPTWA